MANEDEESFVPAYKKYAEMQDAILAGIDKVHARLKRLNWDVGAEWVQPGKKKGGPSKMKRLYNYLKGKLPGYGEPKTHFEPVYSEAEKREREGLKVALEGFEKYNPKESKGAGLLKKTGLYAEKLFGKKRDRELSDYAELKDTLSEEERARGLAELEAGREKYRGEKLEEYNPKESKEYGVKDRLKDIGAAMAKVKMPGHPEDKLENYVELEDKPLRHPEPTGSITFAGAGEDAGERYLVGKDTIGVPITEKESKPEGARKSDNREAYTNKLLRRRKISDMDQYAPEHSGR